MQPIDLEKFEIESEKKRKAYRSFITKLENQAPQGLDKIAVEIDQEVWKEIDCLSCANCCKKMTPTFTQHDIKRISSFLRMNPKTFKEKWLKQEKGDTDWVNISQPCQFLDLTTNMCSIYEVRPADCAGFPHFTKKKAVDYLHIHKQNIAYCPATLKFIELLKERKL
ncbi:MAG TPA: YkgJ family cysteine cluster protein [Arachidicoccus sp.]